jgi:FkbM family methyltransferase
MIVDGKSHSDAGINHGLIRALRGNRQAFGNGGNGLSGIRIEKIPSGQTMKEIDALVDCLKRAVPPSSRRHLVGPLVSGVRNLAWRMLGLGQSFEGIYTAFRRLAADQSGNEWHFREGARDKYIFHEVVVANEYKLPASFKPDDIIIDVGMHIGCFCYAALSRGSHRVYGYEADRENYNLAVINLRPFGERVHPYHKAVWRSDRTGDILFHPGSSSIGNSGGGTVYWPGDHKMDVIAFDDILQEVTDRGKNRVKLVKMDCEWAEFPILLTSRHLSLIDSIHGEFHEMNDGRHNSTPIPPVAQIAGVERFTLDELSKCLDRAGFSVTAARTADSGLGKFFATRQRG